MTSKGYSRGFPCVKEKKPKGYDIKQSQMQHIPDEHCFWEHLLVLHIPVDLSREVSVQAHTGVLSCTVIHGCI